MKKGKSRNKRKKTRSRLRWIAIAVIGIAAVISVVCVAGMLATKENVIIPELSEPPVRTLGATIPENESHIFR